MAEATEVCKVSVVLCYWLSVRRARGGLFIGF